MATIAMEGFSIDHLVVADPRDNAIRAALMRKIGKPKAQYYADALFYANSHRIVPGTYKVEKTDDGVRFIPIKGHVYF